MQMMDAIFDYRLPRPALRSYVRQFQIVGCRFPSTMETLPMKPYWPRAENTLGFFPWDREQLQYGTHGEKLTRPASVINGQYTEVTNRYVGRNFMVFQVQFQPGVLFRLTGMSLHEITNTFVDAETIFGTEMKRVNQRLSYANNHQEMIPIVEHFLLSLIQHARRRPVRPIDQACAFLLDHPDTSKLDWLADQACLSPRQFYRQFVEREGVSPKLLARIARFENAIKIKNKFPAMDWLSVAMQFGYHDYQHLVRDFKEFTSMTPNAFLNLELQAPERAFGKSEH